MKSATKKLLLTSVGALIAVIAGNSSRDEKGSVAATGELSAERKSAVKILEHLKPLVESPEKLF